jgi:O-acetyl-ADP-ribose deacetylase
MESIVIGTSTIEVTQGDIVEQRVDAIVNAANSELRGGGGVDGAIHAAGGADIMAECRQIGSCPVGHAVVTTGGRLPAKHVIHAVGPKYKDGTQGEPELLMGAINTALRRAVEQDARSIAFPAISTGAYGYPAEDAADVTFRTVRMFLKEFHDDLDLVRFVLFDEATYEAYAAKLKEILADVEEEVKS